jgi:hypothetical protein
MRIAGETVRVVASRSSLASPCESLFVVEGTLRLPSGHVGGAHADGGDEPYAVDVGRL